MLISAQSEYCIPAYLQCTFRALLKTVFKTVTGGYNPFDESDITVKTLNGATTITVPANKIWIVLYVQSCDNVPALTFVNSFLSAAVHTITDQTFVPFMATSFSSLGTGVTHIAVIEYDCETSKI